MTGKAFLGQRRFVEIFSPLSTLLQKHIGIKKNGIQLHQKLVSTTSSKRKVYKRFP